MRAAPLIPSPRILLAALAIAIALTLPGTFPAQAQIGGGSASNHESAAMQELRDRLGLPADARARLGTQSMTPLEAPVDPRTHVLAPGDELALAIWGAVDTVVPLTVTADGQLVIPSVGIVPVTGLTLAAAAEQVRAACAPAYPRAEISLALVRPGMLRVPVTGQVLEPGTYEVPSTYRLTDLIAIAGGLRAGADARAIEVWPDEGALASDGAPLPRSVARAARLRSLEPAPAGQVAPQYDLLAWRVSGERAENPVLCSGQRVHVPAAQASYRVRGVFAGDNETPRPLSSLVDRPFVTETRLIAARGGDTLAFVLAAAGGLGADFAGDAVILERARGQRRSVPLDSLTSVMATAGDIIEIPFACDWVAVSGSVVRPGYYPFLPGQTVAQYVNLAGGPNAFGREGGWKVYAPSGERLDLAAGAPVGAGARIWVPERRWHKFATVLTPLGTAVAVVVSLAALLANN